MVQQTAEGNLYNLHRISLEDCELDTSSHRRTRSRHESAGLSLTSAAIIAAVLVGNDTQLLFLAFLCCLFVALYQAVNFYLGRNLQQKVNQSRVKEAGTLPKTQLVH